MNITEQFFYEILEVYYEFDENVDGSISRSEFFGAMKNLGMNPSEDKIDTMFNEIDLDNSGSIEFNELLIMAETMMNKEDETLETKNILKFVYSSYDRNWGWSKKFMPTARSIRTKDMKKRNRGLDCNELQFYVKNNQEDLQASDAEIGEFLEEVLELAKHESNYSAFKHLWPVPKFGDFWTFSE